MTKAQTWLYTMWLCALQSRLLCATVLLSAYMGSSHMGKHVKEVREWVDYGISSLELYKDFQYIIKNIIKEKQG